MGSVMGYEKMSHFDVLFFQKSGEHLKEQVMTCKFSSDPPGLKKNIFFFGEEIIPSHEQITVNSSKFSFFFVVVCQPSCCLE